MIFKAYNFSKLLYGSLCEQCLSGMQQPLTKWRKEFITDVLWLILSIQGKVNFSQLARYGNDVRLQYILSPEKTGKRGRPKTNGGVVDVKHPDENYFSLVMQEDTSLRMYTAVVKAVSLKRPGIVVVQSIEDDTVKDCKIFFSTDIQMEASLIMDIYKSRFQIEFIYRDAKQHTGLTHCQARDEKKLHFHFNISLTAVNIAKAVHWYSIPKPERKAFSLADIKVINHNTLLLEQFFAIYATNPNILKNKQNIKELVYYGTKAA